jgi:hypothetical protein
MCFSIGAFFAFALASFFGRYLLLRSMLAREAGIFLYFSFAAALVLYIFFFWLCECYSPRQAEAYIEKPSMTEEALSLYNMILPRITEIVVSSSDRPPGPAHPLLRPLSPLPLPTGRRCAAH